MSGMVGKMGSAGSPQSPGGTEDPTLSKVPPVPMPRRFAPVGTNPPLFIPKHPSSSYLGVADGVIRVAAFWIALVRGSVTLFIPFQAKGRQKRVKAVADCKGDKARELTFSKGEVIVVTREEDEQIWVSHYALTGAGIQILVLFPLQFSSEGGWVFRGGHGWRTPAPCVHGKGLGGLH